MRIIHTEQAFIEYVQFQGGDPERLQATLPAEYELKYGAFLETLHKCLKCGGLFDDDGDMSDGDICKQCEPERNLGDPADDEITRLKEEP